MTQKKSPRACAAQIALFSDPERRAMSWDKIPEPHRQRIIECLAQVLAESSQRQRDSEEEND